MKKGFIIKENAGLFDVFDGSNIYQTKARGKFRIGKYSPSVGDYVDFDENQNLLLDIKERVNELKKPNIVNVENSFVVASMANPAIQLSLINRYIVISELIRVKPIIILTKIDLDNLEYTNKIKKQLEKLGYQVVCYSSKTLDGLDEIKKIIKGKKFVFFGQSGVGKSTLINLLVPGSRQKTNEISTALGRGKHTTRIVEYLRYEDSWLADTPGFSNISFELDPVDIACFYPGFDKYYSKCKFRNCLHDHEADCEIKKAVEQGFIDKDVYDDYLLLLDDIKNKKKVF